MFLSEKNHWNLICGLRDTRVNGFKEIAWFCRNWGICVCTYMIDLCNFISQLVELDDLYFSVYIWTFTSVNFWESLLKIACTCFILIENSHMISTFTTWQSFKLWNLFFQKWIYIDNEQLSIGNDAEFFLGGGGLYILCLRDPS